MHGKRTVQLMCCMDKPCPNTIASHAHWLREEHDGMGVADGEFVARLQKVTDAPHGDSQTSCGELFERS